MKEAERGQRGKRRIGEEEEGREGEGEKEEGKEGRKEAEREDRSRRERERGRGEKNVIHLYTTTSRTTNF